MGMYYGWGECIFKGEIFILGDVYFWNLYFVILIYFNIIIYGCLYFIVKSMFLFKVLEKNFDWCDKKLNLINKNSFCY